MELIGLIIGLVIQGLVVGALGRLAIPGPNPMTIGSTIAVGVAGSFLGGLVGYYVFNSNGAAFLLGIAAAALIVFLLQNKRRPRV